MGESITFIDGDTVGDTVTRVHHDTGGTARGIEGEDSLDGDIHGGQVEGFEHDLGHLLPVGLRLRGASVRRTGCSSGATRSSLYMVWCQIFSMSSQLVMIPCSTGYLRVRIPLLDWASSPTYASFCPIPTITPWCLGRPTMEGKTALGASSPAKPALHIPDPLSITRAATSSSHIFAGVLGAALSGVSFLPGAE